MWLRGCDQQLLAQLVDFFVVEGRLNRYSW